MKLLISKRAAKIAVISALPFMALASYFWIQIYLSVRTTDQIIFYSISQTIFLLGSPLTLIYILSLKILDRILTEFLGNNLAFLVLPILNLLFLLQWIIWSQLIVYVNRKFFKSKNTTVTQNI